MNVATSVPSATSLKPGGSSASSACARGRCSASSESRPATASEGSNPEYPARRARGLASASASTAWPSVIASSVRPALLSIERVLAAQDAFPRGPAPLDSLLDPGLRLVEIAMSPEVRLGRMHRAAGGFIRRGGFEPCGLDERDHLAVFASPIERLHEVDRRGDAATGGDGCSPQPSPRDRGQRAPAPRRSPRAAGRRRRGPLPRRAATPRSAGRRTRRAPVARRASATALASAVNVTGLIASRTTSA